MHTVKNKEQRRLKEKDKVDCVAWEGKQDEPGSAGETTDVWKMKRTTRAAKDKLEIERDAHEV